MFFKFSFQVIKSWWPNKILHHKECLLSSVNDWTYFSAYIPGTLPIQAWMLILTFLSVLSKIGTFSVPHLTSSAAEFKLSSQSLIGKSFRLFGVVFRFVFQGTKRHQSFLLFCVSNCAEFRLDSHWFFLRTSSRIKFEQFPNSSFLKIHQALCFLIFRVFFS